MLTYMNLFFQALLRGALSQQSAVILVCMAIDRYVCLLHPARYHRHSSKKVSFSTFIFTILTIQKLLSCKVQYKTRFSLAPSYFL